MPPSTLPSNIFPFARTQAFIQLKHFNRRFRNPCPCPNLQDIFSPSHRQLNRSSNFQKKHKKAPKQHVHNPQLCAPDPSHKQKSVHPHSFAPFSTLCDVWYLKKTSRVFFKRHPHPPAHEESQPPAAPQPIAVCVLNHIHTHTTVQSSLFHRPQRNPTENLFRSLVPLTQQPYAKQHQLLPLPHNACTVVSNALPSRSVRESCNNSPDFASSHLAAHLFTSIRDNYKLGCLERSVSENMYSCSSRASIPSRCIPTTRQRTTNNRILSHDSLCTE